MTGTVVCSGTQDANIMIWLTYTVFTPMQVMTDPLFKATMTVSIHTVCNCIIFSLLWPTNPFVFYTGKTVS